MSEREERERERERERGRKLALGGGMKPNESKSAKDTLCETPNLEEHQSRGTPMVCIIETPS